MPLDRYPEDDKTRYHRDATWMRVLGPEYDSGWLPTGDNPHESAKHHVRKWCKSAEDHYFIAKKDPLHREDRGPNTPVAIMGLEAPVPIWHRQREWRDDFPLPDNLWTDHGKPEQDISRGPNFLTPLDYYYQNNPIIER